ncbi:MAG: protease modulator HflC [Oscillospiraceae bacterium]
MFEENTSTYTAPQPPKYQYDQEKARQRQESFSKFTKNFKKSFIVIIILIAISMVSSECFYQVNESEHAVRYRFNEIIGIDVNNLTDEEYDDLLKDPSIKDMKITRGAGIKMKIPFIEKVDKFNNRLITYDTMPREVITSDKKKIILDNNAQWWIINPVKFKITMKTINSANQRIEDLMYSKMNEKVGLTTAHDLISNKELVGEMLSTNAEELNKVLHAYGIKVADIQIKRTDFPTENNENIFNRMRTEREQMARQYRSEGKEEAQKIRSTADKEAAKLRAEANAEAQRIRGKGDADAAAIFNKAYNADPEFYKFYKSIETYKATLPNSGAKIVISPDSEFAQYLFHSK